MSTFLAGCLLAQAEAPTDAEGNPILGLLVLGTLAGIAFAVFGGKKKDRYAVSHATSVRKLK